MITTNWEACLAHLFAAPLPGIEGGLTVYGLSEALDRGEINATKAKDDLAKAGFGLLWPGEVASAQAGYILAVPNSSRRVSKIFEGTRWAAGAPHGPVRRGTAKDPGVWRDALRQAPPDIIITDRRSNRIHLDGKQLRCTLVMLNAARTCIKEIDASSRELRLNLDKCVPAAS